jgi:hypothetical protein
MISEDNETEELIFDYLEGNLSPREREAFEILMADDNGLREQMQAWKKTYVSETFPASTELEHRIVQPYAKKRWMFSLNSFVITSLILLCIPASLNEKFQFGRLPSPAGIVIESPPVAHHTLPEETSINTKNKNPDNKKTKTIDTRKADTPVDKILSTSLSRMPLLTEERVAGLSQIPSLEKAVKKQTIRKQLTRQQIRKINKKKRRYYERILGAKYSKGKVPYVIPLNSNF